MNIGLKKLIATLAAASVLAAAPALSSPTLRLVTESDYQWTGVAVSSGGRIFLSFPTFSEFPSFHLAELKGGVPVSLLDRSSDSEIANLTGIFMDGRDRLWALDAGMAARGGLSYRQPKILCISIRDHRIQRSFPIPQELSGAASRYADLRIDLERNCAYVTDGGMARLVTVDLSSGKAWVALDETVSELRASAAFISYPAGNFVPEAPHLNGLTLSEDGSLLYFTPLISTRIYSIPTSALADPALTVAQRRRLIRTVATDLSPSAGMVARGGKLYTGDLRNSRILSTDLRTGKTSALPLPSRFNWADDFASDSTGGIWFTESESNIPVEMRRSYRLYRLAP